MKYVIFAALFFIILFSLLLGVVLPIFKHHKKATGGIINYDSAMRKFVYKVNLNGADIISLLKTANGVDELSCTFDFDRSVIKFSEYGSHREYYFRVLEYHGFSILRLEQAALIGMSSYIPYKLNPFIVSKLHAEIIPFSRYGF